MPTYEYECTACGQHIEVFQRFAEDALTTCGVCGGALRKVFHPAGIVFKGSGFYVTDSRSTSSSGDRKEAKREDPKGGQKEGKKEPSSSGSKDSSGKDGGGTTSSPASDGGPKSTPSKDSSS